MLSKHIFRGKHINIGMRVVFKVQNCSYLTVLKFIRIYKDCHILLYVSLDKQIFTILKEMSVHAV